MKIWNRSGAELYLRPQNSYDAWQEYNLAQVAKSNLQSSQEEKKEKSICILKEKVFWDVIIKLVNAGLTSDVAVDEVYNFYGRSLPVTTILNKMIHNKETSCHPNLQVKLFWGEGSPLVTSNNHESFL